jgi:tRNA dimethylallyltransferase
VDPDEEFSAAEYARRGRAALLDIAGRGRLPILAGGTGLYLQALLQGLFVGPSRDVGLRQRLEAIAERHGDTRLHRLLARVDPEAAARLPVGDRLRVVRALEVFRATGRPISEHHRAPGDPLSGFSSFLVGITPPRPALRLAVEQRTREMFERGLLDEVKDLLARGYDPEVRPLRAIGYRQALAVLRGQLARAEAERDIVSDTLRLAKRQMTWFRHQASVAWCPDPETAHAAAVAWLDRAEG